MGEGRFPELRARAVYLCERLRVRPKGIRVRKMTRKWGSCSTSGVVTLAADLASEAPGFQDFVIAHELLHLRHPNHGRVFKATMTMHVPDWREHDRRRLGREPRARPDGDERRGFG